MGWSCGNQTTETVEVDDVHGSDMLGTSLAASCHDGCFCRNGLALTTSADFYGEVEDVTAKRGIVFLQRDDNICLEKGVGMGFWVWVMMGLMEVGFRKRTG